MLPSESQAPEAVRGDCEEGLDFCQAIRGRDVCSTRVPADHDGLCPAGQPRPGASRRLRCVEVLRAELDVPPSAETVALYRQIGG